MPNKYFSDNPKTAIAVASICILLTVLVMYMIMVTASGLLVKNNPIKSPCDSYYGTYAVRYAVRYRSTGHDCTIIRNSHDEGYYWPTAEEAKQNGRSAMSSDKKLGYTVYEKTLEVFPVLVPREELLKEL